MFMPHGKAFGAPRSSSFPALPVSLSSQSNGSHRGLNKQPVHKLPTGQIAINKPSNVQQGWMTEAVRSVYVCVRLCVLSLTSFKSNPQHLFLSLVHAPKMLLLVLKLTAFFFVCGSLLLFRPLVFCVRIYLRKKENLLHRLPENSGFYPGVPYYWLFIMLGLLDLLFYGCTQTSSQIRSVEKVGCTCVCVCLFNDEGIILSETQACSCACSTQTYGIIPCPNYKVAKTVNSRRNYSDMKCANANV